MIQWASKVNMRIWILLVSILLGALISKVVNQQVHWQVHVDAQAFRNVHMLQKYIYFKLGVSTKFLIIFMFFREKDIFSP